MDQLYDAEHLYSLLPEVYRQRDGKRDPENGRPLYDLVKVLAREARVVARDVERLHDNSFIETCDPWAVPYVGDLLGVTGLRPGRAVSARAEVANTLGYRRRKGTASVLEQLARDVTAWPARVVEAFQILAWSQFVQNHVRLEAVAWADVRSAGTMELVDSPFDRAAHTVDVGRAEPREGRHNLPHVVLWLFRLQALPQLLTTPNEAGAGAGRFSFSPLGHPAPLFTHPEAETGIASIAEERHVPAPIRRRALYADLEGEADVYVGPGRSIAVMVPAAGEWQPLAARYVACNLEDWNRPLPSDAGPGNPAGGVVAIDPVLGRLRFEDPARVPEVFRLSSYHGFADTLGGGQYDRSPLADVSSVPAAGSLQVGDPADPILIARDDVDVASSRFFDSLSDALLEAWPPDGDRLIEIVDSRTYAVNLASLEIPEGRRLVVRAEDRQRPTVVLGQEIEIVGEPASRLEIDGLWISGAGLRIAPPPPDGDGNPVDGLDELSIRHTTLVPGHALDEDGAAVNAGAVSLRIETGETEARVERSILGGVRTAPETTFELVDSVLDVHDPDTELAFGGLAADDFGGRLTVRASTLFGGVRAAVIELGENSLFLGVAIAERRQKGCVRYSWVPLGSRVPRRYRCQPDPPEGGDPDQARRLQNRLRPRFTSRRYGRPGYAQLDWRGPRVDGAREIVRGAEDGSEMGVFHRLEAALREDDLRRRLDEYLPAALEAGIFYAT